MFSFKQCVYFDSQCKHYGCLGVSLIEIFFNTELKTKESLTKCNHNDCDFQIFTHLFKLSNGSTVIYRLSKIFMIYKFYINIIRTFVVVVDFYKTSIDYQFYESLKGQAPGS